MNKSLFTILILVSISFGLNAQTFWKQYSPQYTLPSSSVLTPDNGLMIAGMAADSGFSLLRILRIDSAGNIIFSMQNYLTQDTMAGNFHKIIKTRDGNFLAMGWVEEWPVQFGIYLHKFDINGNTIWDRFIYNNNCSNLQLSDALSIIETSDGGFAMSGRAYLFSIEVMYILKTDSTGNPQWFKDYNIGRDLLSMKNNLCEKSDSGFVAFEQLDAIQQDGIIICTDKNGSIQSSYTLDSTNTYHLQGIYKLKGNLYLSFDNGFVKTNLDTNAFSYSSYNDFGNYFFIESINESLDSDFLLAFNENMKFGLMRVDTSGNIIWTHSFSESKLPKAIYELPDRSYLLDGIGYSGNTYFVEVMKLDTTGNIDCYNDSVQISIYTETEKFSPFPVTVDSCQLSTLPINLIWHSVGTQTDYCISTGVNEAALNSTLLFPNPSSGILFIQGNNKLEEISIYDVLGNRIINERIKDGMNSIDISFLSPGIYLCRVISAGKEEFVKLIMN